MQIYNRNLKDYSRELRKNMTEAELILWSKLRMRQLNSFRFCRQVIIGDSIVDFYCPSARLVVEVDGGQHYSDEMLAEDRKRDELMQTRGLTVLRFSNADVRENIEGVIHNILENLA
jgi:very-short-patch-repair endonuclease